MYKRKPLFVTFEGIEGSGKSYQCKRLFQNLRKRKIPVLLTREPGGTPSAEKIREIILKDYFYKGSKEKFDKYTDTLLYLAARNEHVKNKIRPAMLKNKNIICDRFTDSTIAYQVHGKGVKKSFIDFIHKHILKDIKPDITFVLKVKISKALKRMKKRKIKNRYDKFSKGFYIRAQNSFLNVARTNKKRYLVINNSYDTNFAEEVILNNFLKALKK